MTGPCAVNSRPHLRSALGGHYCAPSLYEPACSERLRRTESLALRPFAPGLVHSAGVLAGSASLPQRRRFSEPRLGVRSPESGVSPLARAAFCASVRLCLGIVNIVAPACVWTRLHFYWEKSQESNFRVARAFLLHFLRSCQAVLQRGRTILQSGRRAVLHGSAALVGVHGPDAAGPARSGSF